jgi:hypothetical protein
MHLFVYAWPHLRRREEWSLPPLRKRLATTASMQSPLASKRAKPNMPATPKAEVPTEEALKEDRILKYFSNSFQNLIVETRKFIFHLD